MEKLILAFFSLLIFKMMVPVKNIPASQVLNHAQEQSDGPYVQYKNGQAVAYYIIESNGMKVLKKDSIALQQKENLSLDVMTDIPGKSFHILLKKKLQNEKSEFPKIKNLVALSDIEGNFSAFRKLLQATNVIDENFNWKFGNGDLVLTGDFFDRGEQVTEVLWFIYYLEEKAKAAGGYIHFILGNHEIMNLTGDVRYTPQKYLDNAALLREPYTALYDKNSELGRWLRTKNVVEKIGSLLFTHGGISGDINRTNISIPDLNKLARPYYDDTTFKYPYRETDLIFSDLGPFWYRGYYVKNNPAIEAQVDSTLTLFNVSHIITGHTIVSDTISVWYNGKVLNTDVHHAEGKSEALLIENGTWFRVNAAGNKTLLMGAMKEKD